MRLYPLDTGKVKLVSRSCFVLDNCHLKIYDK